MLLHEISDRQLHYGLDINLTIGFNRASHRYRSRRDSQTALRIKELAAAGG